MSDNLNLGHRKRLKQRFLESPSSLYDYEILEAVLFSANSRKDTKNLAKKFYFSKTFRRAFNFAKTFRSFENSFRNRS